MIKLAVDNALEYTATLSERMGGRFHSAESRFGSCIGKRRMDCTAGGTATIHPGLHLRGKLALIFPEGALERIHQGLRQIGQEGALASGDEGLDRHAALFPVVEGAQIFVALLARSHVGLAGRRIRGGTDDNVIVTPPSDDVG